MYEHTSKEMAEKLLNFICNSNMVCLEQQEKQNEIKYLTILFNKLRTSEDFEVLADYLDTMFMDSVFNI